MRDKLKKGQRAAGIATVATLLLSAIKGIVGMLSGSLLLIADAVHSSVDILAIFASWFGLKISRRKPNQRFPYGYYKAENLATLFIVGFILYAGYEIFITSFDKLFQVPEIALPAAAAAVPLFSALVSYFIARYEEKVGNEINSQSLIANARESKADVISSLVVFAGIVLSYFKIGYVEGIIGMLMSLMIVKIGYDTAKAAVLSLMDASPDEVLERDIRKVVLDVSGAKDLTHLKLRQSGTYVFGEARVKVSKNLDVNKAHEISEKIEQEIRQKYPVVGSFLIHIEPYKRKTMKILIPVKADKGLDSPVVGHFARAQFFFFAKVKEGRLKSWSIKKNPFAKKDVRAGLAAAKLALKEGVDAVVLSRIGEISFHTLRDGYADVLMTDGKTAKEVIAGVLSGRAKKLSAPTHGSEK